VTPDDDNSFLVLVYSEVNVDDDCPIATLSDEEMMIAHPTKSREPR
jgi:hypothetical protein